jgi:thiamine-monophosphate kinase
LTEEFARIAWLSRLFSEGAPSKGITLGIGDDAAVLTPLSGKWVWTIDACVEDVHFRMPWLSGEDLGWRSYNAAVSDLAAMGARPVGALSSLALPANIDSKLWQGIARGQARAAKVLGCPVIGGNITRAAQISIHTTAVGQVKSPILRQGAQPSDEIWLVGNVGTAAAGLAVLMQQPESKWDAAMRGCVHAWRRPRALVEQGLALNGQANAAIDISDGLAGDARHVADASEVALVLDEHALERAILPRVKRVALGLGCSALDWALGGGEDYALLATGQPRRRPAFARCIGSVERGRGVWLEKTNGERIAVQTGFDHFAK